MLAAQQQVRVARPADRVRVADLLVRAFADDALVRWVYDRAQLRARASRRFFRWSLDRMLPDDAVWTADDFAGAALWALPGNGVPTLREQVALVAGTALTIRRPLTKAFALDRVERAHPREPHLYLAVLGVEPARQGQGLGSALLRPGLALADEERWPAFLETVTPRNLDFYGRHGFAVIDELALPGGGPPVWQMWREPQ